MDYWKALMELHAERQRLDKLIASLEALSGGADRRGRKGMSAAERKQVSERMKGYWAARRNRNSSNSR